jgi:hypothetical protein
MAKRNTSTTDNIPNSITNNKLSLTAGEEQDTQCNDLDNGHTLWQLQQMREELLIHQLWVHFSNKTTCLVWWRSTKDAIIEQSCLLGCDTTLTVESNMTFRRSMSPNFACCLLRVCFLLGVFFGPEEEGDVFLGNFCSLWTDYTVLHHRS